MSLLPGFLTSVGAVMLVCGGVILSIGTLLLFRGVGHAGRRSTLGLTFALLGAGVVLMALGMNHSISRAVAGDFGRVIELAVLAGGVGLAVCSVELFGVALATGVSVVTSPASEGDPAFRDQ